MPNKPTAGFRFQQTEEDAVGETCNTQEAFELTGKSVRVIQKWCREGRIRYAKKVGGRWHIPRSEIVTDGLFKPYTSGFLQLILSKNQLFQIPEFLADLRLKPNRTIRLHEFAEDATAKNILDWWFSLRRELLEIRLEAAQSAAYLDLCEMWLPQDEPLALGYKYLAGCRYLGRWMVDVCSFSEHIIYFLNEKTRHFFDWGPARKSVVKDLGEFADSEATNAMFFNEHEKAKLRDLLRLIAEYEDGIALARKYRDTRAHRYFPPIGNELFSVRATIGRGAGKVGYLWDGGRRMPIDQIVELLVPVWEKAIALVTALNKLDRLGSQPEFPGQADLSLVEIMRQTIEDDRAMRQAIEGEAGSEG